MGFNPIKYLIVFKRSVMISPNFDWSFFDSIRCINLYTRPDRYNQAKEVFRKYNIPVDFYQTHKHPNGGKQGCFESHLAVIRNAYDQGCSTVLIFEDDLMGGSSLTPQNLANVVEFMRTNSDWDLFYFGIYPDYCHRRMRHIQGNIYHLHSLLGHAYVVSRRMMAKMYNWKYTGQSPDDIYYQNDHAYAFCPSLFYQNGSSTDIEGHDANNSRFRYMKYRAVEIYAQYVNIPLVLLLPVLLLLIIGIFVIWRYNRQIKAEGRALTLPSSEY